MSCGRRVVPVPASGVAILRGPIPRPSTSYRSAERESMVRSDVAKRKNEDTTVPPITGTFEDAVKALLATPPPPKNLGRPPSQIAKKKKSAATKKAAKR